MHGLNETSPSVPPDNSESFLPKRHSLFYFANASFNTATSELLVDGEPGQVEPKPKLLLQILLDQPGVVVTRKKLVEKLWPTSGASKSSLDGAVNKLRQALKDHGGKIICTVHLTGYRLAVSVDIHFITPEHRNTFAFKQGERVATRPAWWLDRPLRPDSGCDVWLARNPNGDARVFKFADTPDGLKMLQRKALLSAELLARLGSRDDLVPIVDQNFEERPYFVVSPYCGPDLRAWLASTADLAKYDRAQRVTLVLLIARAIAAAQSAGVLHGNLNPGNILIETAPANDTPLPHLDDFGGSAVANQAVFPSARGNQSRSGASPYVAPEITRGEQATAQADVFALGILLYGILIGELDRPLTPGWELEIDDELLRKDIAAAGAGIAMNRLQTANEFADRLAALDKRHAEAEAARREADQAAAREKLERRTEQCLRETLRETMHARAVARRSRQGLIACSALLAVMTGVAFYAQHQHNRAAATAVVVENTVSSLVTGLAQQLQATKGVTIAVVQRLLEENQNTLTSMHRLAQHDPRLQQLEAEALIEFAQTYSHQGDPAGTIGAAQNAAALLHGLQTQAPHDRTIAFDLMSAEGRIGDAQLVNKAPNALFEALSAYQAVITLAAPIVATNPLDVDAIQRLAQAEEGIGDVQIAKDPHNPAALATYRKADAAIASIAREYPQSEALQSDQSKTQEKIGDALDALGYPRLALSAYQVDLAIRQKLVQSHPQNTIYSRNLGVSYNDVGDEQTLIHDYDKALAAYHAAFMLALNLLVGDPSNAEWQDDASDAEANIADTLGQGQHDWTNAVVHYQDSIARDTVLLQRDPTNIRYAHALMQRHSNLATVFSQLGRTADTAKEVALALGLAHSLAGLHSQDAQLLGDVATIEALPKQLGLSQ